MTLRIERSERALIAHLSGAHQVCSWAIVGGGIREARAVVWCEVRNAELPREVEPRAYLRDRLRALGQDDAIGLMTSSPLSDAVIERRESGGDHVHCVATVGLSNALRAGDVPGRGSPLGTINLLVVTSAPLSVEAQLEALALTAEARSVAVVDAKIPSRISGAAASGTGTDCIAVASPATRAGALPWVGKHTSVGHLIGAAVHDACVAGIERWRRRQS